MFERFTERARQVVVLAQEEARALRHDHIGTEHLLLGLLREEQGIAARLLESHRLGVDEVRAEIRELVGEGEAVTGEQMPFTPRAKKALELALREALRLRHSYIGTEHVLLGVAQVRKGVAARVLHDRGIDPKRIRDDVVGMLSGQAWPPAGALHPGSAAGGATRWEYRVLELETASELAEGPLNALGDEGWELVSLADSAGGVRLIFKRRRQAQGRRGD